MARKFYRYPPRPSSGAGTFSDNIVGLQTVEGGGLTQGNFEFSTAITDKVNRDFYIGAFSDPISLDSLKITNTIESRAIIAKEYGVFPNFDVSDVSNFTLFGSMAKRMEVSIKKIINFFPAAIEVSNLGLNYETGYTAYNIVYDPIEDTTTFNISVNSLLNPFEIDYSINATRNLEARETVVAFLRNLTVEFSKYSLFIDDLEFLVLNFTPTDSLFSGELKFLVSGKPFNGVVTSDYLVIRPNTFYTEKAFAENFDEVERFLLNRLIEPVYTANFQVPKLADNGVTFATYASVTWPLDNKWNLDIITESYTNYVDKIFQISQEFDSFKTNTVARFLITDAFKEFDTPDQRVTKVLQIWGREFDDVKKFIDGLAYINSVNYNVGNDIPSQLLKNLAQTLGWSINISPISEEEFLSAVFGNGEPPDFTGFGRSLTPNELNYQFYRNLILNSAYLFKSKGTRKSIEFLLRMIGAPEALIEFNENIYLADGPINMSRFNQQYAQISAGTFTQLLPQLQSGNTYTILGNPYTAFTTQIFSQVVDTIPEDYPVDEEGYPRAPIDTDSFYFQKGAGWYELTPQHQSPLIVNQLDSVFTGQNPSVQTTFEPFTYGQKYLDRFRFFPYMNEGFDLVRTVDNKKSWPITDVNVRISTENGFNAYYFLNNEKNVLNVKNVDLFMNPGQGLLYDVWYMSNKYDYPIPLTGLTNPYPTPGGVDWTIIDPKPQKKTFFEFSQSFWKNMINVRNRQFISDGKTGGYPTLQSLWWKYLDSQQAINVPNDNFTYQRMIDYVNGMGDYWMKLVEQMIPATTIWNGGVRYENSILHRQKVVYRLQRGCQIVPVPCKPCTIEGQIFPLDCINETYSCSLFPWNGATVNNFNDILYQTVNNYLNSISANFTVCSPTTIESNWFVDVRLNNDILVQQQFYTGYGLSDVPTETDWVDALNSYLPNLVEDGLYYSINDDTLTIYNLACTPSNVGKTLLVNVGINFKIICDI